LDGVGVGAGAGAVGGGALFLGWSGRNAALAVVAAADTSCGSGEPSSSRFWSREKFWRGSRPCGGAHQLAGWGPEALAPPVTMDRAAARRHGGVLCWARPLASGGKGTGGS
jgi:hypothetical protein